MKPPFPGSRDWSLKVTRIMFILQFFIIMVLLWMNEAQRKLLDELVAVCRASIAAMPKR